MRRLVELIRRLESASHFAMWITLFSSLVCCKFHRSTQRGCVAIPSWCFMVKQHAALYYWEPWRLEREISAAL